MVAKIVAVPESLKTPVAEIFCGPPQGVERGMILVSEMETGVLILPETFSGI